MQTDSVQLKRELGLVRAVVTGFGSVVGIGVAGPAVVLAVTLETKKIRDPRRTILRAMLTTLLVAMMRYAIAALLGSGPLWRVSFRARYALGGRERWERPTGRCYA